MVHDVHGQLVVVKHDGLDIEPGTPVPDVVNEEAHDVHFLSEPVVEVLETAGDELLVVGLKGERGKAHDAVPVISARTTVWIESLIGVLHRNFGDVSVHIVSNAPKQFPVGGLLGPLAPRVEDDPYTGVHGHIKVSVGHMSVDVGCVCCCFCFAERAAPRLGGGAGVPVVVVISVEVHLVDVPAGVNVVAVRIEHDEDVEFGILQDVDGLFVPLIPAVDVPFCRQPCQGCSEVFVSVVAAVNVDDFLGRPVGFGLHRPVRETNDPKRPSKFRLSGADQINDVRVFVRPIVDLHREGSPCHVNVIVDGFTGPNRCLRGVVLGCRWWKGGHHHANNQADGHSHGWALRR